MRYPPSHFAQCTTKEKRRKDSLLGQIFYRPLSFVSSSICAELGITANAVSFFSWLLAIAIITLLCIDNQVCRIVGSSLILFWNLLDCTDGNLARGVKKQHLGEYLDAMSSFFLTPGLVFCAALITYYCGGLCFQKGDSLVLSLGAGAMACGIMGRLLYQKFSNTLAEEEQPAQQATPAEKKTSGGMMALLKKAAGRFECDAGIGGFEPLLLGISPFFNFTDIVFFIYGGYSILTLLVIVFFTCRTAFRLNHQKKVN